MGGGGGRGFYWSADGRRQEGGGVKNRKNLPTSKWMVPYEILVKLRRPNLDPIYTQMNSHFDLTKKTQLQYMLGFHLNIL